MCKANISIIILFQTRFNDSLIGFPNAAKATFIGAIGQSAIKRILSVKEFEIGGNQFFRRRLRINLVFPVIFEKPIAAHRLFS